MFFLEKCTFSEVHGRYSAENLNRPKFEALRNFEFLNYIFINSYFLTDFEKCIFVDQSKIKICDFEILISDWIIK